MKNSYPGYEIEKYLTREACQAGIDARNSLPEDLKQKLYKDYGYLRNYTSDNNPYSLSNFSMNHAWSRGFRLRKHFVSYSEDDAIDSEIIADDECKESKDNLVVEPAKSKWWNRSSWFI